MKMKKLKFITVIVILIIALIDEHLTLHLVFQLVF